MAKLFKLNVDRYVWIDNRGREFEGDELDVMAKMVNSGIPVQEVELGANALQSDDVAEYGVNRTFLFSKKLNKSA
jgi:hypothetical protein